MPLLEILGWAGSALLVVSVLQTRVMRFRVLNAVASAVLLVYNAAIEVWPMVGMNAVLVGINLWVITGMVRRRHDERAYDVVQVGVGEPYLEHVLRRHAADIAEHNRSPERVIDQAQHAFLVTSGDALVGVVMSRAGRSADEQQVLLDYVLPPYRDFTPGEFVYRPGGPFTAMGARRVVASPAMMRSEKYLGAIGFRAEGDRRVLHIAEEAPDAAPAGAAPDGVPDGVSDGVTGAPTDTAGHTGVDA